jgi:N-acetylneuraminic acid mutarotase
MYDVHASKWRHVPCVGDVPPQLVSSSVTSYDSFVWLFGGFDRISGLNSNALYKLDVEQTKWSISNVSGDPPRARNSHSFLTYEGSMVMFGGWDGGTFFDDLFVLQSHGSAWTQICVSNTPGSRPQGRMGHSACIIDHFMYVLGGFNHPKTLDDFWKFNFREGEWEIVEAVGMPPSDRYRHSSIPMSDYIVVFGGLSASKQRFNDLFCFDVRNSTWLKVDAGSCVPSARCFHQAAVVDGAMYVFGGVTEGGKRLNDTFRLVNSQSRPVSVSPDEDSCFKWIDLSLKALPWDRRTGHTCFLHSDFLFVFGGSSADGTICSYLSRVNLMNVTKETIVCSGDTPPPLSSSKAVSVEGSVFLFGGVGERRGFFNNSLYRLSVTECRWTRIVGNCNADSPTGRADHSMALIGEELVVYGGRRRRDILGDIFAFSLSGACWRSIEQKSSERPSARFGHTAVPSSSSQMIVFGGWDGHRLLDDLWILDVFIGSWRSVTTNGGPKARYRHTAVVLDSRFMCVFGGVSENQERLNDLFILDMIKFSWARLDPVGTRIPEARTFHQSVLWGSQMVCFGGRGNGGNKLSDIWSIKLDPFRVLGLFERNPDEEKAKLQKRIAYLESRVMCKICMDREINVVLIPCTHRCICLACASIIVNRECACPICRETIVRLVETIDA